MKKTQLSIVINTKNAAMTLKQCLESITDIANEIVVVDMHSTDTTLDIAKKYTSNIFTFKDTGYVEPARNFALSKATSEWILLIDADEVLTATLSEYIKSNVLTQTEFDVYKLPRKNIVFNKWIEHTGWWPDYQVRLFKKGTVTWENDIHSQPVITGKVKEIEALEKFSLEHYNYTTIEEYLDRLQRYTTVTAQEHKNDKEYFVNSSPGAHAIQAFRREFISRLFAHNGMKDLDHGIILSLFQSMYEVTIVAKMWQQTNFKVAKTLDPSIMKELKLLSDDIKYWVAHWHVQNTNGLVRLYWKLKRKYRK